MTAAATVLGFLKRRPGVTIEAFRAAMLDAAGTGHLEGMGRYVQHHARLGGYRKGEPPFDTVVEALGVGGGEAPELGSLCPDGAALLVDPGASFVIRVSSVIVKNGDASQATAKAFALALRPPTMARDRFFEHWTAVHGPIASAIPPLLRYVQYQAEAPVVGPDGRLVEGCGVTWFTDIGSMRAAAATPEFAQTRADEPNFLDGTPPEIITTEHVIVGASS